jgi:hypothetical protein
MFKVLQECSERLLQIDVNTDLVWTPTIFLNKVNTSFTTQKTSLPSALTSLLKKIHIPGDTISKSKDFTLYQLFTNSFVARLKTNESLNLKFDHPLKAVVFYCTQLFDTFKNPKEIKALRTAIENAELKLFQRTTKFVSGRAFGAKEFSQLKEEEKFKLLAENTRSIVNITIAIPKQEGEDYMVHALVAKLKGDPRPPFYILTINNSLHDKKLYYYPLLPMVPV